MATTLSAPVTTSPSTTSVQPAAVVPTVWRHGLVAGAIAALATLAIALVADAAGVSLADSSGKRIPLAGFPELTMIFALVGWASRPGRPAIRSRRSCARPLFSAPLSVVPDLTMGFDGGSAAALVLTRPAGR